MLLAVLVFAATASAAPAGWEGPRMRVGHDPSWSSPTLDDSSWTPIDLGDVPQTNDSVWLRWKIDLTDYKRAPGRPFGVYFAAIATHEIWWDGVRIGGSGVVGRTKEEETPGLIEAHYQVPDALVTPGPHTVAVRASAFHRGFRPVHGYWTLIVGNYDRILAMRTRDANLALIALSGILMVAVFAFAMFWLTRRDRSFLLLGTLCLSAAALLVAEAWRPLFGYTYDWHIVRLRFVLTLSWLTGVQLVALVVTRFPHRFGKFAIAGTVVLASTMPLFSKTWDPKSIYIFMACLCVATLWTAWAAMRRMHGSVLAFVGVAAATFTFFINPVWWLDKSLYFALNFVFVCLLCSHALEVRREQHEKARLELEMVRRHLQPHFVMNTLTALSEWIEQDPKTAVRMIDSLAEEIRILGQVSTKRLVTAEEELRLCRTHLANMSLRKDIAYELELDGVDGQRLVPPAVFHTLVENAITHGPTADRITLKLSATSDGDRTRYVFEAPVDADVDSPSGGGTRYIEARLREAWGEAWSFRQGRSGAWWRAEIEVPA